MTDAAQHIEVERPPIVGGLVAGAELRQLIERIERLEEEKAGVASLIKEVFVEAKGRGFDTKAMREVIKLRKKSKEEREQEEILLDLYLTALGM